jgi:hypothetical protein
VEAEAPVMVLAYQPPALFPAAYAAPWTRQFPADPDKPVEELADADNHPGETIAIETIVVERASVRSASIGGQLTEAEMVAVLVEAGWPAALHAQALAVAWCESMWSPNADGDQGRSKGLFQLNESTWFRYAGEDPERWADPLVNARVAWATYQYDIGRGYEPWTQWSCKP